MKLGFPNNQTQTTATATATIDSSFKPLFNLSIASHSLLSIISRFSPSKSLPSDPPKPTTTTAAATSSAASATLSGCAVPLFRPYVAKVPWHGGVRAFLSQMFPRYGHYCGPNWSSGRDGGIMLWDYRPIDWLDFCCYCHDIGYDTHDQAKLLRADLAFLECLERPRMATKGDAKIAQLYKSMCITGLRFILIPYRMHLVKLQSKQSFPDQLANIWWKGI
ncbi:hypothetical protein QJS04_geneDACA007375 [Acorus gramineus]|uniref:Phospholipase A2 family protein n=1 Tax=Acorus gramineus TaxID=55184 RepID=A0AAV9BRE5_ACOGR|nr:hypothetical protein QJS04_geneDACA007375 [Acorus gramineus]